MKGCDKVKLFYEVHYGLSAASLPWESEPEETQADFRAIESLLDELPDAERRMCIMQLKGFRTNEIADQIGVSIKTVKRTITWFHAKLRADSRGQSDAERGDEA